MDGSNPPIPPLPPKPSQDEINAFVDAAGKGDAAAVAAFISQYRIFVDLRDGSGHTALIWAIINKQKEMVELLLDQGARVSAPDSVGWLPLTHAAYRGQEEMVDFLIARGAAVDGLTPLMRAAGIGMTGTARRLLEKGANLNESDFQGRTAKTFAQRARRDTAELLAQWPEIQRRREEEKKKLAEEQADAEAKKQAEQQIEKLKNKRPPQSPLKKKKP